jgi:hypothetical protein
VPPEHNRRPETSLTFLGEEWFARSRAELGGSGPVLPGANARIQYDVAAEGGGVRWCQVIDDGRVIAWERGDISAPDVEIRWSLDDAFEILSGRCAGAAAALATTIAEQRPNASYVGPPPPLDLGREPELGRLRRIPDANLTLHYELRAAPFGTMQSSMVFVDGQLQRLTAGLAGTGDVVIVLPFRQLMRLRRGDISMQDALQFGSISGAIDSMVFLAAILESLPYRHAALAAASGPAPMALAALGELGAANDYAKALADLMAATHRGPDPR